MKKIFIILIIIFLTGLMPAFFVNSQTNPNFIPGQVLVKFKNSNSVYKIKFSTEEKLNKILDKYNNHPLVEYAEPNYIYQTSLIPPDVMYGEQETYLEKINAPQAWNISAGSKKIIIAIIDSGIDLDHPDLKNNLWTNFAEIPDNGIDDDENGYTDDVQGWDFVENSNNPEPELNQEYSITAINHGTVVAGIAAAEGGNAEGGVGIAWRASIMPLRVLDNKGFGTTDQVAEAINYAVKMGAKIINLSFVGSGESHTLANAIRNAYEKNVLVVAAAGNEISQGINLDETPAFPVSHDGPNGENWVIGVASIDKNDKLASFSNYGSKNIDISTPGVSLFSTTFHNPNFSDFTSEYQTGWTGTSVSAPQVSGAAALIMAVKPNLTLRQIKELLINNTTPIANKQNAGFEKLVGSGRLNIYNSLSKSLIVSPSENTYSKIITTPASKGGGVIRTYKKTNLKNQFIAFKENYTGTLSIASADLDKDGKKEIVVGLDSGDMPWVKIYSEDGTLKNQITAYHPSFKGGIEVALGDINGDNKLEIITVPRATGGPHVRIFDSEGNFINHFFAYDKKDTSGLEVACADINRDGIDEIITVNSTSNPTIKIFNQKGNELSVFHPFNSKSIGAHIAAHDLDNNGYAEIIVGAGINYEPNIKIFDPHGNLQKEFLAYNYNFRGGVYVTAGDIDSNGTIEIISGPGSGGGPHIKAFTKTGALKMHFFAFDSRLRTGARVYAQK
jgi:subtilisin family serine protease